MTEVEKLLEAADLVADCIMRRVMPRADDLTAREAYKAYGRAWVERAVAEHLIAPTYQGNKTIYSRAELDALRVCERRRGKATRANNN